MAAFAFVDIPKKGDTILVLDQECLQQVLDLSKTMLIRTGNMKAKWYWLGYGGTIYGRARTRPSVRIGSQIEWEELRPQHRDPRETSKFDRDAPPDQWTNTFGVVLEDVRCVQYVDYVARKGASTFVTYRPLMSAADAAFTQAAGDAGTPYGQRRSPKKGSNIVDVDA